MHGRCGCVSWLPPSRCLLLPTLVVIIVSFTSGIFAALSANRIFLPLVRRADGCLAVAFRGGEQRYCRRSGPLLLSVLFGVSAALAIARSERLDGARARQRIHVAAGAAGAGLWPCCHDLFLAARIAGLAIHCSLWLIGHTVVCVPYVRAHDHCGAGAAQPRTCSRVRHRSVRRGSIPFDASPCRSSGLAFSPARSSPSCRRSTTCRYRCFCATPRPTCCRSACGKIWRAGWMSTIAAVSGVMIALTVAGPRRDGTRRRSIAAHQMTARFSCRDRARTPRA